MATEKGRLHIHLMDEPTVVRGDCGYGGDGLPADDRGKLVLIINAVASLEAMRD